MNVLLINPPREIKKGNIWRIIKRSLPPLGLGYIAACLERENVRVKIIDLQAEKLDFEQFREHLKELAPTFVGISSTTVEINGAQEIARIVKEVIPDARIVFGGVHPTIEPDGILSDKHIDFVVRGEGEKTFIELVKGKSLNMIKGFSYKVNGKIIHNPEREFIENLDDIPFPAYHLLPMNKYFPSSGNYKRLPATSLITTRGCPGRCTFCYTKAFGKKTRYRTAKNILEEILFLQKNYGIKEISFYDDTFTTFKDNVMEFCSLIRANQVDLTWSCMSRVDKVDREVLAAMKSAGCHQIGYGVESANKEILKNIRKPMPLEKTWNTIKITKEVGIDVRLMFMLGNPGETRETMEQTINFAIELDPDIVVFNITTPYPGTEMFNWAKEKGYLLTFDWPKYDLSQCVMRLPTVSPKKLEEFYRRAYRKFYLRPLYLLRRLKKIKNWTQLKMNLQAFFSMVGK